MREVETIRNFLPGQDLSSIIDLLFAFVFVVVVVVVVVSAAPSSVPRYRLFAVAAARDGRRNGPRAVRNLLAAQLLSPIAATTTDPIFASLPGLVFVVRLQSWLRRRPPRR